MRLPLLLTAMLLAATGYRTPGPARRRHHERRPPRRRRRPIAPACCDMSPASMIAWELSDDRGAPSQRFWPVQCEGLKLGAMPLWAVAPDAWRPEARGGYC